MNLSTDYRNIEISTMTFLRFFLIALSFIFIFLVRDILLMLLVAIVIAAAVSRPAEWLERHRIPRLLAVLFIYFILFGVIILVLYCLIPSLVHETKQLSVDFPYYLNRIDALKNWLHSQYGQEISINFYELFYRLSRYLTQASRNIFNVTFNFFGSVFSSFIILVISFYLAVRERGAKHFLVSLTPKQHQEYVGKLLSRIEKKMSQWVVAQLILMLFVGFLTYIGLKVLDIKFALTLALIAGVLELVPYIGPVISTIPAVFIAFLQNPILALWVIFLYILVQQIENHFLVPQIMKKAVGLNPVIVIIVILVGGKLAGILGVILAVPMAATFAEFLKDVIKSRSTKTSLTKIN